MSVIMKKSSKGVCRSLREKGPCGLLDDADTIYWCIKATGAAVFDNKFADTSLCRQDRICFEPWRDDERDT